MKSYVPLCLSRVSEEELIMFCGCQVLLPLDVLKIKRQVNPEAFRGRGIIRIIAEENTALYRGWGWTMARNAPGSFAVCIEFFLLLYTLLTFLTAFRCICRNERLCSRSDGLLESNLVAEFHRFYRWCRRVYHRRCSSGYSQDAYTERQL